MKGALVHFILNTILLIVIAGYLPGFFLSGVGAACIASLVLALMNLLVRPLLVILTLPITILTFGLFLFVIQAITLMLAASVMGEAFEISGFGTALLAAVLFTILNALAEWLIVRPLLNK